MKYSLPVLPLLLLPLAGCGAAGQVAGEIAAKTISAAMSGSGRSSRAEPACRGACDAGTYCDLDSGTCVPNEVRTMADYEPAASGAPLAKSKPPREPIVQQLPEDDSCGGFCLSNEICRVQTGADDVQCVPRPRDR